MPGRSPGLFENFRPLRPGRGPNISTGRRTPTAQRPGNRMMSTETPSTAPAGQSTGRPGGGLAWGRIVAGISIVIALTAAYWLLSETGALDALMDRAELENRIQGLGFWGPLAVIVLIAGAIVLSPVPSAPIALAAGAAYGHAWGAAYVVVGAETGALVAFGIARWLGHEVLRRWFGERLNMGLLGSQNTLMGIVFVTRLLPFISFDLVSYAAGLTPLAPWRFAVATLAGIIPASFLLAHFGGEMISGETQRITVAVLALGGLTVLPVVARLVWVRWRSRHKK